MSYYEHKLDQERYVEIPALRWRGGKTYMEVDDSGFPTGREVSVCHAKPIHWRTAYRNWDEIDCSLTETRTAFVAPWNDWTATFFKDRPETVVHRRGGLTLRSRVIALEAGEHREKAREVRAEVLPEIDAETGEELAGYQRVVYRGVFEGVDLRWRNDHAFLKLSLDVSEAAKERLLESATGDLALVVEAELSGAEMRPDGPVVWLLGERAGVDRLAPITVIDAKGKRGVGHWAVGDGELRMVVPLEWLSEADGAVEVDPNYYGSTADGIVLHDSGISWDSTHDANDGAFVSDSDSASADSVLIKYNGTSIYQINRSFFYFDTSGIPNGATINSADLYIYGYYTDDIEVCAQQGTQSASLVTADFDNFSGNLYGVFEENSGDGDGIWNDGKYNQCNLDGTTDCPGGEACDDGRNDVVDTGTTKICIRDYAYDYKDVEPGGLRWKSAGAYYAEQTGTTKDPYLLIDHSPLSTSTSTTASTTSTSTSASTSTTTVTSTSSSTSTTVSTSTSISTSASTSTTTVTSTSSSTSTTVSTSTSISTSTTVSTSTSISTSTTATTSTSTSITTTSTSITTTSTSITTTSTSITTTSTSISTTTALSTSTTASTSTSTSVSTTSISVSTTSVSTSITTTSVSTSVTTMSTSTVRPECLRPVCNPGADQILVPEKDGLVQYNLLNLFGFSSRKRRSVMGAGMAPLHFITQRGPYQDGETAAGMRHDARVLQLVVAEQLGSDQTFWNRRDDVIDLLRPNRTFQGAPLEQMMRWWDRTDRLVYRRWLPGGDLVYGDDLESLAGSNLVTCASGRFVHYGLKVGSAFFILTDWGGTITNNHGEYKVTEVVNDYTVRLDHALNATGTDQNWMYRRSWAYRDLYCLLEAGPNFDQGPGAQPFHPTGYEEVLRLVAHDPYWYGEEQEQDWNLLLSAGNYGDLVFDGAGAWLGAVPGEGRWVFIPGTVAGETGTVGITYWGTAPAFPTIHLTGPMENFSITNSTTGDQISLYYDLDASDEVTIDVPTRSVWDQAGNPLTVYAYGDLTTFGLYPPPAAPRDRQNTISVSFSGATAGTSNARMTWRNAYVGI